MFTHENLHKYLILKRFLLFIGNFHFLKRDERQQPSGHIEDLKRGDTNTKRTFKIISRK